MTINEDRLIMRSIGGCRIFHSNDLTFLWVFLDVISRTEAGGVMRLDLITTLERNIFNFKIIEI